MRTNIYLLLLIIFFTSGSIFCQTQNWHKLIPLESTRNEVEKVLGKPEKFFETYGTYQTDIGRFSVWYSKGGCHKNTEGLQWNIAAKKMTRLLFYPKKSLPLESYASNIKLNFKKQPLPAADINIENRHLYISTDETVTYETIMRRDSTEFVYTIELSPSKDKHSLLCKEPKEK